jgi:hypothetical protein
LTTTDFRKCKGEYDELLWIPGAFKNPWSGKQTYRATRAYVSTGASLYNGLCPRHHLRPCVQQSIEPGETRDRANLI